MRTHIARDIFPAALLAACVACGGCALRSVEASQVADAPVPGATLEQRQRQTGVAYRRLQEVRWEKHLAEQDYLNADAAYRAAQTNADALKRQADDAKKGYAAAQARAKAAEEAYERGMRSVDVLYPNGGKGAAPAR
jgi:hypothetical protein